MQKIEPTKILISFIACVGVFLGSFLSAEATSTFITQQGGTGTSSPSGILTGDNGATNHLNSLNVGANLTYNPGTNTLSASGGTGSPGGSSGQLQYNGSGSFAGVSTTTVSCSGSASCTSFVAIGSSPITISASGGTGGTGNVSTSTHETAGGIAYWTSNSATPALLGEVATSTLTASSPLTGSFTHVGTTGSLGCQTASGSQAGCLASADWTTFNNKQSALTFSTGLNNSGGTVTNTGVLSNIAGTGIGVSGATGNVTISNTGVTSIVAGTNITVSGSTGAVTINSTASGGSTLITAGTGIATSSSSGGAVQVTSIGTTTATLWADVNRTISNQTGTIEQPFESLSGLIAGLPTGVSGYAINMSPGTYVDGAPATFPNLPTYISGNESTYVVPSGLTIPNSFDIYDLAIVGNVNETDTSLTAIHQINNGAVIGNLSLAGNATVDGSALQGGVVNAVSTSLVNLLGNNISSLVYDNGTMNINDDQISTSTNSSYLVTSTTTGSAVFINGATVINTGTGGAVNVSNGATTEPNDLSNVNIVTGGASLTAGTAATLACDFTAVNLMGAFVAPTGSNWVACHDESLEVDNNLNLPQLPNDVLGTDGSGNTIGVTIGSGLSYTGGTLTATGGGSVTGIQGQNVYIGPSSSALATSTPTIAPNGAIGIGTTTPFAEFSIATPYKETTNLFGTPNVLFAIASTTQAPAATTTLWQLETNAGSNIGARIDWAGNITNCVSACNYDEAGSSRVQLSAQGLSFTAGNSAGSSHFTFTGAADTALTASTNVPVMTLNFAQTRTHATGAVTEQDGIEIEPPTETFAAGTAAASNIGIDTSMTIYAAPLVGARGSITSDMGLYIPQSPASGLAIYNTASTTTAYGEQVWGPELCGSGCTSIVPTYAAAFMNVNVASTTGIVGIGTTTPMAALSVQGTFGNALPEFTISSSTNSVNTTSLNLFTVLANGNVGIGTTTPFAVLSVARTAFALTSTPLFAIASSTVSGSNVPNFEIDASGHVIKSGPVPTISSCGTSSFTGAANDGAGEIGLAGTALTACTVTFATPYTAAPVCTVSDNTTASVADITSISTTQIVFGLSVGITTANLWYQCEQTQ